MLKTHTQGRSGRADGKRRLAVMAGAFQDHIIRNIPRLRRPNIPSSRLAHRTHTRHDDDDDYGDVDDDDDGGDDDKREFVLDPPQPPLTLAQKLGLVATSSSSSRRLSANEWMEMKSRSLLNGDSSQPCSICTEEFRLQPQVLLSCSHVFHRACLRKFERFSGRKCCPLCRTEQYETRVIHDGARLYREKCALRIQAWWLGCIARQQYRDVKKVVPLNDLQLRRRFFEKRFQEINESLVQSCHSNIDSFLRDLDHSVAESRDVFHLFELLQSGGRGVQDEEWMKAHEKACRRDSRDCPICLTPLRSGHLFTPVLLLSCSHLFHQSCLRASEHFCQEGGVTCPVCRRHYVSLPIHDFTHETI